MLFRSMENNSIVEDLYLETEKRLNQMEQKDYDFPKKITKIDVVLIAGMISVSILLIGLCMIGAIK